MDGRAVGKADSGAGHTVTDFSEAVELMLNRYVSQHIRS